MSFRLFSHKPLRSLVLSVAGGSLLTVGCMQNPRSMVARDLSADGKKKSAPAVAGRTTNPFARAGSGAPAAAGPKSQGVFASFFGSKTTDTDGAVDPFLEAETAIAQSRATAPVPPAAKIETQVASANINPFGFLKRKPAESEKPAETVSDNPFEELRRRREVADAGTSSDQGETATGQPAQFVAGFDSQMDRLRAALRNDVRQTSMTGPAESRPEERRHEVEALVAKSRAEFEAGNVAEAYRIAQEADGLARESAVILGPESEHPADLLAMLREKLATPIGGATAEWAREELAESTEVAEPAGEASESELSAGEAIFNPAREELSIEKRVDPFSRPVPDFGDMIVDSESVPPRIVSGPMKPAAAVAWSDQGPGFGAATGLDPGRWTEHSARPTAVDAGVVRASANRGVVVTASATTEAAAPKPAETSAKSDFWNGIPTNGPAFPAVNATEDSEPAPAIISAENVEWSEAPVTTAQPERSAVSGLGLFALGLAGVTGFVVWFWRRRAYALARRGR